jgi:hypothetical protein
MFDKVEAEPVAASHDVADIHAMTPKFIGGR